MSLSMSSPVMMLCPTAPATAESLFGLPFSNRMRFRESPPHIPPRTLRFNTKPALLCSVNHEQALARKPEQKELIQEIGEELVLLDRRCRIDGEYLFECLILVDLIQRLGIHRFFEEQIKRITDTAFRKWDEENGLGDADVTVLAFRLLRLDGYNVSADVLNRLNNEDGNFSDFSIESRRKCLAMLNLHKCSQMSFPFESELMGRATMFSSSQLSRALLETEDSVLQTNGLGSEVKFALEFSRRYLLPRMESRSIIRRLWPSSGCQRKCLELAKEDLEIIQKQHKQEMSVINSWWDEQDVKDFPFSRGQVVKCFFTISMTVFEQEFSAFRAGFTKSAVIITLIDDLFDYPTSDFSGTSQFLEAVKRWDPSLLNHLHEHKAVFACLDSTLTDMAIQASSAQGRDLLPFYKSVFQDTVAASAKEAEWRHTRYVPTLEEYLKNATVSIGALGCYWTSVFLMGETITDEVTQHTGPDSRFLYLVSLISRLANDIATYRREAMGGEMATAVGCYMRDNPWCTEEEAITSLRQIMESACLELEWELFCCRGVVPECCSRPILNFARIMSLIYKRTDAFTDSLEVDFEELIKDYLFGSF